MKLIKLTLTIAAIVTSTLFANAQWGLNGNSITSGQFLGTVNNADLLFKRNNEHIFSVTAANAYSLGWLSTTNTAPNGNYSFSIGDFRTGGGNYYSNNSFSFGTAVGHVYSLNSFAIGNNSGTYNSNSSFAFGNNVSFDDDGGYAPADKSFGIGNDLLLIGTKRFAIGSGVSSSSQLFNDADNSLAVGFNSTIPTFFVGGSGGPGTTGRVGIATTTPAEKLDVNGAIRLGTTTSANAGTIKFDGTDFWGYAGGQWKSLTAQGAGTSQWVTSGANISYTTGNVGIGTTNASYKLVVNATPPTANADGINLFSTTSTTTASLAVTGNTYNWAGVGANQIWLLSSNGDLNVGPSTGHNLKFMSNQVERMRITSTGNVAIGTACVPSGYKLAVKGNIICEALKIKLEGGNCWADYVFDPGYKLLKLDEVEAFIAQNKHLPGVPSAKEVGEHGIEIAEMDATLLKKIEELTLYVIELQKQVEVLKNAGK